MAKPALSRHRDVNAEYTVAARWVILFALMLGTVLEVLDTSIVNVAIPEMMGNLGATIDQIGWVSTGYIIANVIILPLTGWLSARFGRRNYLTFSILLFTLASLLCGTSRTLNGLVAFRILQGVGGAALLSTAQATLIEIFPRKQLGTVQAIFSLGVVMAPTLGPTLGGYITDNFTWPWIFFINLPIGILAAALTFFFLRDSKYQQGPRTRVDLMGIGLLAIGLGCFQTVLERGRSEDWFESNFIVTLSIIALVSLCSFVWWELRVPEPAVNLRILKNKGFSAGIIFAFVLGFGLYGGVFILPIFLQNVRHFTAEQTGLILLPGGIATGIAAMTSGRLIGKVPPRAFLFVGIIGIFASMYILSTITADTGPTQMLLPLILRGFALGCLFVPLTVVTLASLPPQDVPSGSGFYNLNRQLGGSIGIALLSTILDHRTAQHRAAIVNHVSEYNTATMQRLELLQRGLMSHGSSLAVAKQQALMALDKMVSQQASILAFEDSFLVIGFAFLSAMPLVLMFKAKKQAPGAAVDAH